MLDYMQAAFESLRQSETIRSYYDIEEDITLENFFSKPGSELFEIIQDGICLGFIARAGVLASGEEAFRVTSDSEREFVGKKIMIGENGRRYVKEAGAGTARLLAGFPFSALDNISSGIDHTLEDWEQ